MSIDVVSPLRQRMIEDMTARKLGAGPKSAWMMRISVPRSSRCVAKL